MKKNFLTHLLQASLMCCLAVLFTACDEVFGSEDNPIPAYLSMSTSDVTLKVGESKTRTAIAVSTAVVEYSSSDPTIATVDQQGTVTGEAAGTATITATATGYSSASGTKMFVTESKSYKVTVGGVTSLSLNNAIMRLDKTDATSNALTATVVPSDAEVTWTSSDETVATVDATGKITMLKAGKITITAKAGDKTATSTVYVYDKIFDISAGSPAFPALANGKYLINGNATTAVGNSITIPDGATVTLNNVNNNASAPIKCDGTATIILADGSVNTLTATSDQAGIKVGPTGKTLTIDAETAGTGKLAATGGSNGGAGIGSDANYTCGAITINGGIINATGGNNAAGIGTGNADAVDQQCQDISILGGTVTAIGGSQAAGIGTGYANAYDQQCLGISILGGTVIATGGDSAAGIGTGKANGGKTQDCVQITIGSGVTSVTANRGSNATNPIGKGAGGGTQNFGTINFGTTTVFNGTAWDPASMVNGNYGGLNLAISSGTWTLTPAP